MKNYLNKTLTGTLYFLIIISVTACVKENTDILQEPIKDITGEWRIEMVTRNKVDITDFFNFQDFSLTFNDDGTYHIANEVPFIIDKDGSWEIDPKRYTMYMKFVQGENGEEFSSEFDYPIVQGRREIILKGSPGCMNNIYEYVLRQHTD